jgi:hypothetical protein
MIPISNLYDCQQLNHDPELQREVISYLLYCQYELQEYDDDPDSQDFSFSVFQNTDDFEVLEDLGTPEETVRTEIRHCQGSCVIHRLVYVTEVLFIQAHLADNVSL